MLGTLAMNFGERTIYAGRMLLIGMGTIFSALLILWIALAVFRRLIEYFSGEDVEVEETPAPQPAAPVAPPPAKVAVVPTTVGDDALVAVITAAVAAALAAENNGTVPGFRVVSFSKVPTVTTRNGRTQ